MVPGDLGDRRGSVSLRQDIDGIPRRDTHQSAATGGAKSPLRRLWASSQGGGRPAHGVANTSRATEAGRSGRVCMTMTIRWSDEGGDGD